MIKENKSHFTEGLSSLYYLLICADRTIDTRELDMGKTMIEMEELDINHFYSKIDRYSTEPDKYVYNTCIHSLNHCSEEEKIRSLAWMKLIANADGNLDGKEFSLIQDICINEFNLSLNQVLKKEEALRDELRTMIQEDKI